MSEPEPLSPFIVHKDKNKMGTLIEYISHSHPTADVSMFKSLPEFVNTFGSKFHSTCILCNAEFKSPHQQDVENSSKHVLKSNCIRSIISDIHSFVEQIDVTEDMSFPFCEECTGTVSQLVDAYRKLTEIQEEFNLIRGRVLQGVINTFVKVEQCSENIEEKMFTFADWRQPVIVRDLPIENSNTESESHETYDAFEDLPVVEDVDDCFLADIKVENEDEDLDDEEPEEFINPQQVLVKESRMNPVVLLGKPLELDKIKKHEVGLYSPKKKESSDSDSDSEVSINEKIEDDDEYQPDPDDENEYVPPYGLKEVQVYRRMTRRTSKMLPLEVTLTEFKEEGNLNETSNDTPTVIRIKRKYARREPGDKEIDRKKKKSSPKKKNKTPKPKVKKTDKAEKTETEAGEGETSNQIPKPTKKRIRKKPTPVTCTVCGKTIRSGYNLMLHMRIHTGEKPYKCTFCPMSFYKPANLTVHLTRHTKDKKYACDMCGMRFAENAVLRSHKASKHEVYESKNIFECEFCRKKFIQRSEWRQHLEKTLCSKRGYRNRNTCLLCNMEFENQDDLTEHLRSKEHIATRIAARRRINHPRHTRKMVKNEHGKIVERMQKCKECDETFPNIGELKKHKRRVHPSKDYVCEVCGKAFSEAGNLNKHIYAVHGNEKPHICKFCGDRFNQPISLRYHMTKHTGESLYNCEHCGSGFNRARYYRRHLADSHPEIYLKDKPLVCKICFMNFATDEEMTEHNKVHDDLVCKYCGRIFNAKVHVQKHILIHTGEKPWKCEICGKCFTQQTNLKEHVYRHTGERPFRCSHCNAGFLRRKEMQKHIDKHHPGAVTTESQKQQNNINPPPVLVVPEVPAIPNPIPTLTALSQVQVSDMSAVSITTDLISL